MSIQEFSWLRKLNSFFLYHVAHVPSRIHLVSIVRHGIICSSCFLVPAVQVAGHRPDAVAMQIARQTFLLAGRSSLTRDQVPSHRKHLARRARNKSIHLPRVLLHLSAVEHAFQSAWLRR